MPHYADGSLAKVGDKVIGKPYNTPEEIVGEILSITPGTESCNCVVGFVRSFAVSDEVAAAVQKVAPETVFRGGDGKTFLLLPKYDYGETKAFRRVI